MVLPQTKHVYFHLNSTMLYTMDVLWTRMMSMTKNHGAQFWWTKMVNILVTKTNGDIVHQNVRYILLKVNQFVRIYVQLFTGIKISHENRIFPESTQKFQNFSEFTKKSEDRLL